MLILFKNIYTYFWLRWAFISEQGHSLAAACGLLTAAPLPVTEHRLCLPGLQWLQRANSVVVAHGLFSCTWSLPGPAIEPMSPALTGRFLPTVPPGRSRPLHLKETR